jgi:hypothetical protein
MIDPASLCFYTPAGLSRPKSELFARVARHILSLGGKIIPTGNVEALRLHADRGEIPIIGCMPETRPLIDEWRAANRPWIYWDRGYARRIYATWLPRAEKDTGYYRWHFGGFQLQKMREVPDDRWKALRIPAEPWRENDKVGHIVIAAPTRTYARFHHCESWIADTIDALSRVTTRQLVIRDKESKRDLRLDLAGAHALVTHGSIAAVEAVVMGYPVFVDKTSAAALVGHTDLRKIESPLLPDRGPWLNSLGYSQFDERELTNGVLWKLLA